MQMDGELFAGLNNLRLVDLSNNLCIDQTFEDRSVLAYGIPAQCDFPGEVCAI